jgi:hypothetical protein
MEEEIEIMKNNQVKMLEMKMSINQIETTVDNITSRQDQTEERKSEMENKIKRILHMDNNEEKNEYI